MKRVKRILAIILAAASVFSAAACQKKTQTAGDGSSEPVTITWYYSGSTVPTDQDMVNQAISKYLKDTLKMNVTLKMQLFTYANYTTQLSTMLAAHEPFDLFFTSGNSYYSYARQGALYEMTSSKLSKYAPDAVKVDGDLLLNNSKVDGKLYGLPTNKDNASSYGLLLNKALVDKYGFAIDSIKSINDLTPMLAVIKEKEPTIYPYVPNSKLDYITACNYQATSGDLSRLPGAIFMNNDSSNTKVFDQFESAETQNYLRTMHSWFKAGYISSDNTSGKAAEGKVFAYMSKLKPGKDKETSNSKATWVQKELTEVSVDMTDIAGSMTAISNTSQHPETALKVLNLAYKDPKFLNMMVYGIEGKHYTKLSDNVIQLASGNTYMSGSGWMFGNQFLNYLKDNEDTDKWDQFKKFNSSAKALNAAGFNFDTTNYTSEVAALTNVSAQYWDILANGQADPEQYLPEFVAKLKANGMSQLIAAQQQQYSDFLKNKKTSK